jgi:hypothetical protein
VEWVLASKHAAKLRCSSDLFSGGSALRSIFINYRRNDSEGEAGRLFDDLTSRYSDESVFMDVAAIEPGKDFRIAIDESVASCTVLLAIIGLDWLDSKDPEGRKRLDNPNDFVRIELATALQRNIPVIPVLVRGARMPRAEQLPEELKELAFRNAVDLTHARWKTDVLVLIRALGHYIDVSAPVPPGLKDNDTRQLQQEVPDGTTNFKGAPATPAVDPLTIERVSRELAVYIGPIAEVVVKRAAKRSCSAEEVYAKAAEEIESDADRAKFLRACRK